MSDEEIHPGSKKKKGLSSPLLAATWVGVGWSGISVAYFLYRLIRAVDHLIHLEEMPDIRPNELDFERGGIITLIVLYAFLLVLTSLVLGGSIAVLRRRAAGASLVITSSGITAFIALIGSVTLVFFTRESRGFILYLLGFLLTIVFSLTTCIYNSVVHSNKKYTKRLR